MKRIEILIADDDADVRETFRDLVVDYKKDLKRLKRDDNLGFLFNNDYKIYYDEAENGAELEQKITLRLNEHPSQYFISFVDEDMPVKRGTDAIAGITELLYSLGRQYTPVGGEVPVRPKVKLVSYTQKQDIDISEGIARDSGASLFLRKTSLDDFYEEMIRIIEHLVLDLTNLETYTSPNSNRKAVLDVVASSAENESGRFKDYLKFRYKKEVLSGQISNELYNNAWMYPDFGDFYSLPLGIYAGMDENLKLIGCTRLVLPKMQHSGTLLMEELLDKFSGSIPEIKGDFRKPGPGTARLDKYYIDRDFTQYDIGRELLVYTVAQSLKLGLDTLLWEVPSDLVPLAESMGFRVTGSGFGGKVPTELNMGQLEGKLSAARDVLERISGGANAVEIKLVPVDN